MAARPPVWLSANRNTFRAQMNLWTALRRPTIAMFAAHNRVLLAPISLEKADGIESIEHARSPQMGKHFLALNVPPDNLGGHGRPLNRLLPETLLHCG
jgi:hypothetical protein